MLCSGLLALWPRSAVSPAVCQSCWTRRVGTVKFRNESQRGQVRRIQQWISLLSCGVCCDEVLQEYFNTFLPALHAVEDVWRRTGPLRILPGRCLPATHTSCFLLSGTSGMFYNCENCLSAVSCAGSPSAPSQCASVLSLLPFGDWKSHTGCSRLVCTCLSLAPTTAEDVVGKLPHPPC